MTNEKQLNLFFWISIALGIVSIVFNIGSLSTAIMGCGFVFIFLRKRFGIPSAWKKGLILIVYSVVITIVRNIVLFS